MTLPPVKKLIDEITIDRRIREISFVIKQKTPPPDLALVVMNGAFMFAADLLKQLNINLKISFIELSSYGNSVTSSGHVEVVREPVGEFHNKNILVIEDIIDTGKTAEFLEEYLKKLGVKSTSWCVLLEKPIKKHNFQPEFTVFKVEDRFLVGYGLDYKGFYRNLPYIGFIEE